MLATMATRRGPDDCVRIALSGSLNTTPWASVFHAKLTKSAPVTQANLDSWTDAVAQQWDTQFGGEIANAVTMSRAVATLYVPGGLQLTSDRGVSHAGREGAGVIADNAACKVVSWLSGVYWRGGKPRTYLPGVLEADVDVGKNVAAAKVTSLKAAALNFIAGVNGLTFGTITATQFGFISFRSGNADRVPPLFFPITSSTVHPRLGTQRRRLGKWLA